MKFQFYVCENLCRTDYKVDLKLDKLSPEAVVDQMVEAEPR